MDMQIHKNWQKKEKGKVISKPPSQTWIENAKEQILYIWYTYIKYPHNYICLYLLVHVFLFDTIF